LSPHKGRDLEGEKGREKGKKWVLSYAPRSKAGRKNDGEKREKKERKDT